MARIKKDKSGGWSLHEWMGADEVTGATIHQPHYLRKGTTKAEAKKFQAVLAIREQERRLGLRDQVTRKELAKGPKSVLTFSKFVEDTYLPDFVRTYPRSEEKKRNHMKHLFKVFGDVPLTATKKELLIAWSKYRDMRISQDGVKMVTLEAEWKSLQRVLNKAAERDEITTNPFGSMTFRSNKEDIGGEVVEKEIQIFTIDDLNAIYDAAGEFWGAQYKFISNTGMRRSEVCRQPKRDVSKELVTIAHDPGRGLKTKSNRTRAVPLSPGAQEAADIVRFHNKNSDLFFNGTIHQGFYRDTGDSVFSKVFRSHCQEAGVNHGTLHGLRHTFISYLANEKNVPLDVVRQLAGHASINTTMKYIHQTGDQLNKAVAQLDI